MSETGVNFFDYVNSKEVFVQSVYMLKWLIKIRIRTSGTEGSSTLVALPVKDKGRPHRSQSYSMAMRLSVGINEI